MPFWPAKFLLRSQLTALQEFPCTQFLFCCCFFKIIHLFIQSHRVLVAACRIFSCSMWSLLTAACRLLVAASGIQLPDQGSNLDPLHWEHRVLNTGPLGKSLPCCFLYSFFSLKFCHFICKVSWCGPLWVDLV